MTRSLARRRITRPLRFAPARVRDPSIEVLGFTCFRLIDGDTPVELTHSTNAMFAFVALR